MRMIVVEKCYVNERIYEPGEEMDTTLPECPAFHRVGGKPIPKRPVDLTVSTLVTDPAAQQRRIVELQRELLDLHQRQGRVAPPQPPDPGFNEETRTAAAKAKADADADAEKQKKAAETAQHPKK